MTDFAELVRRYAQQRAELGEERVVLSRPVDRIGEIVGDAGGRSESSQKPPWMQGAPEVPGPGLAITEMDVFGSVSEDIAAMDHVSLVAAISECTKCGLCATRTNTVPFDGDVAANLMVVGEGPGQHEDAQGKPFVGRAGKLLNDILAAIGLQRSAVYICNIVKCRPPQNRNPSPEEMEACIPYLYRQIELVRPTVILAVGAVAAGALLRTKKSLGQLRNKVHEFNGIPLIVTYHPAALLRNPNWKKSTWDDVRIARRILDSGS